MLAFLKNLAGVKMDKAAQAGIEALVRWDPKSASEAELRTMEQNLDDLGREVALARQSYDRESREAVTIQALSQQRMAAAEQLQRQVDAESDPARHDRGKPDCPDHRKLGQRPDQSHDHQRPARLHSIDDEAGGDRRHGEQQVKT